MSHGATSTRGSFAGPRLAVYAGLALGSIGLSRSGLRKPFVVPAALGAVAVAMWHGAYDAVQARPILEPRFGPRWSSMFGAGYLLLSGVTFAGWRLLPMPSLVLFLAYSAWHFGTEAEQARLSARTAVTGLAFGAIPTLVACRARPAQVEPIFTAMLHERSGAHGRRAVHTLVALLGRAAIPALVLAMLGIAAGALGRSPAVRLQSLAVAALTGALFASCDPLLAFAVYFCAWHTPEHLVATSLPGGGAPGKSLAANLHSNLRAGFLPWLASLLFLGGAWRFGRGAAASYQAGLFIVLSALTVPHMALNEGRRFQSCSGGSAV